MSEQTLSTKRNVLDFLWEWAEDKGNWAKLLLHETLTATDRLSDDTRKIIYRHFRKSIGLPEDIEDAPIEKPSASFSGHEIQLTKLANITGINRLSSNSEITFSPNLTVIYGENGTGKSGFSRILKDIGFSYEAETKLLPNIYAEKPEEMSAKVEYTYDGDKKEYTWTPQGKNKELKDISVYNSSCVSISISGNRNLIITPLGFHLFDMVSAELDALAELLKNEKNLLNTTYEWFDSFHEGTDYNQIIQSLKDTPKEKIEGVLPFTKDDEQKLTDLVKELANLTKEILEKEIKELNSQYTEITEIKQRIETSKTAFSQSQWDELIKAVSTVKRLEEKGYGSLASLASEKGIELFGKPEFERFIQAADVYINTLPNNNYPETSGSKCIYCNQSISDSATIDLIKKYREILKDTTRQELEKQKSTINNFKLAFNRVANDIQLHQPSYGTANNEKALQPDFLLAYNLSVKNIAQCIKQNDYKNLSFSLDYNSVVIELSKKLDEIEGVLAKKKESRDNIETKRNILKTEIIVLEDKKIFTDRKTAVLKIIANYQQIKILSENESAFNTTSISTKTNKARKELVEQAFEKSFREELQNLRKGHISVELNFGTKKGGTNIRQSLKEKYNLSDILSEGEQKAISLAEFFTELRIDGSNSTVIFDDPVNSLDHHIIDETAKRLILLSKTRQTVIFTHSILLFNSFLYQSKLSHNKSLERLFYNTKNQYEICGIITLADEEINKPKSYISQINSLINNSPKDRPEAEVSAEGYGYLRSAIELTVEHEILKGTVKRYQKNIALTNFLELSGAEIDKCKIELNDIFEKCCGSISAHSNPVDLASTPDMKQLKTDFEAYKKIREMFTK